MFHAHRLARTLPVRTFTVQTRSLRSSLPVPPPMTRVAHVEVVSEYPAGHDLPLSSTPGGGGGGGAPAAPVEPEDGTGAIAGNPTGPTDSEAIVQADRGALPENSPEALRLKWNEIEVKPGGPLGKKVIVETVEKEKVIKK